MITDDSHIAFNLSIDREFLFSDLASVWTVNPRPDKFIISQLYQVSESIFWRGVLIVMDFIKSVYFLFGAIWWYMDLVLKYSRNKFYRNNDYKY